MSVIDDELEVGMLKQILEAAGKFFGVGSYRPEYGRFEVEEFKTIE